MPKVIYIAGPISGVDDYKRNFNQAENALLVRGHIPLKPSWLPKELTNERAMRVCLSMIDQADGVLFLPDWQYSLGATLEHDYCKYTGKPIYYNLEEVPNR